MDSSTIVSIAHHLDALQENVTIAMVGKYIDLADAIRRYQGASARGHGR